MGSYNGAFPGHGRPASAGSSPEPSRGDAHAGARDEDESIPPPPPTAVDAFAEFEGGIAGESTRIDESLLSEQSIAILDEGPRLPFLFVEAGKDAGKEYALQEGETSVGRGIDNDVILADVSVSRRHVRVLREGPNITLRDLGSGNGTQLNGRRAHVEPLQEGDRIEIGETVLVLRIPGAELPVAEPSNGHATHETLTPNSDPVMASPMYPTPNSLPPLPTQGASTDSLMAPPRDGRTQSILLPRRMLFIAAAVVAVLGSVLGAAVVSFVGRGTDPVATGLPLRLPAVAAPVAIPAVNAPAVAAPAVAAPAVAVPAVAVPAVGAPAVGAPAVAPAIAVPAVPPPAAVVPVIPTATPTVAAAAEADEGRGRGTRAAGTSAPRRTPEPSAAPASSAGRDAALAAYRAGDFAGAARLAREAARAGSGRERTVLEHLADQIDSFGEIYPRIRGAGTNYASVGAVGAVAIRLDRSIASGHHTRTFQAGFVDWLLDQAESSFASDPAGACRQARSASDIEASARTRTLLERCDARATELMAEAGRAERSDPRRARELYGAVLRIVPSGAREASEAQRHIDALGRARTVDEDE